MEDKNTRQQRIVELIINNSIYKSQKQIENKLKREGYEINQSTISRDFAELGIKKENGVYTLDENRSKKFKYSFLQDKLLAANANVFSNVGYFLIKTAPGEARSVSVSIENIFKEEVIGSISSEDTALIFTKDQKTSGKMLKEINVLCNPSGE